MCHRWCALSTALQPSPRSRPAPEDAAVRCPRVPAIARARPHPALPRLLGALLAAVALAVLLAPGQAQAATRVWTGGGGDNNWTTAANWGGTAPVDGDVLQFPDGALRMATNVNDFPSGTTFSSIQFTGIAGGYVLGVINVARVYTVSSILNADGNDQIAFNLKAPIGGLTVTTNGTGRLTIAAGISGATSTDGLTKAGAGTLRLAGSTANTYTGTTTVNQGTLELTNTAIDGAVAGPLVIGDGVGGADADVVRLQRSGQIADTVPVTVTSSGLLDLNGFADGIGPLTLQSGTTSGAHITTGTGLLVLLGTVSLVSSGTGAIGATIAGILNLDGGTRTFTIDNGAAAVDLDVPAGVHFGGLTKAGPGTLRLGGISDYTGPTTVNAGTLLVNGNQSDSAVTLSGGTLGGSGIVGPISSTGGTIAPGNSTGILTVQRGLTLVPATTVALELNGTGDGSAHDVLQVVGPVNLGGATLSASLGYTPSPGDALIVVNSDGTTPITGTFAGLPEGSRFLIGGRAFEITYQGNSGNDVVLSYLPPCQPRPNVGLSVAPTGTGSIQVTVSAQTNLNTPTNTLSSIAFSDTTNGLIDIPGGVHGSAGPLTVGPPVSPQPFTFFVRPRTPGGYVTVPMVVTDGCGTWTTFVGGGPTAFPGGDAALATPTPTPGALGPVATPRPIATAIPSAAPTSAAAPAACSPRPSLSVTSTPAGSGRLQVTIAAPAGLTLQALRLGALANAVVDAGSQTGLASGATVPLAAGTTQTALTLRRVTAGQASTASLTVVDSCGDWPTVVGGGPTAF